MATVHYGRLHGPAGFSRTVAIKRLHPMFARDPEFVEMFLAEARLAARIRHPNVAQTLDVIATEGEIFLVLEYILGESLSHLRRAMTDAGQVADPRVVASIIGNVLRGLHAAHEAKREDGEPLDIVHRDVSPQNVLVGADGVARVIDFGVAKAIGRTQTTREGQLKGKIAYMPPERLCGQLVTRQCDVYGAAVVAWELLTRERLFRGDDEGALVTSVLTQVVIPPSVVAPYVPSSFDRVIMRGLERDPTRRYATAKDMAHDIERCAGIASASEVGEWVESLAGPKLAQRVAEIARIEGVSPDVVRRSDRGGVSDFGPAQIEPRRSIVERREPSEVSRVAVTRASAQQPARTTRAVSWQLRKRLLVGGTIGGAVIACALALPRMFARTAPASAASTTRLAAAGPDSSGLHAASPHASLPEASSSVVAEVTAAATQAVAESSVAAPRLSPASARSATPRPRPPRANCDIPFTVDDRGYKHYKAGCF
jgi:serine/threonine-protein kinase